MEKDMKKEHEAEINAISNVIFSFHTVLLLAFTLGTLLVLLYYFGLLYHLTRCFFVIIFIDVNIVIIFHHAIVFKHRK